MQVLVIPDVHLKPWMFDKAEEILQKHKIDKVVCLGDIVDDWNKQYEQDLYLETLNRLISFAEAHSSMLFCWGNHDRSYFWQAYESGYSVVMEYVVPKKFQEFIEVLPKGQIGYIHRIDNVLFCHGGLTEEYVNEYFRKSSHKSI